MKQGGKGMQRLEFSADEILGSNGTERVKKCHESDAAAEKRAADTINPEMREVYLDLRRQWQVLADDIKKVERNELQTGDR
jgi:hypothetical protein